MRSALCPPVRCQTLRPVKLRNAIEVDPQQQDFFRRAIEQRQLLKQRNELTEIERERLNKFLKVISNATSYGIYAETIRREREEKVCVTCFGVDAEPFECWVRHPDEPGVYCFPPLASLITGAARLNLALLEYCVTQRGGTYAMEDTDSMAIVATEHGGLVPCPGGTQVTTDGSEAVKALSRTEVQEIVDRFQSLNPYDRSAVPGSILKIEEDNYDPETHAPRQLYCYAISAKRYALFSKSQQGDPVIVRRSNHGLGHLLNPGDPKDRNHKWIADVWLSMIRRAMGLPAAELPFKDFPAVGRVSVTSPAAMRPLEEFNAGKSYAEQIKPFNFVLTCQVRPFGYPSDANEGHFHLIAPYTGDPSKWFAIDWIDQYGGHQYKITTRGHHGSVGVARVRTYGEILREYEFHPETKCAEACGKVCRKQAIGLLQRRHVLIDRTVYIGKESNKLEDVDAGLIHSPDEVYTQYCDPRRDEWTTKIQPALRKAPLAKLVEETGLSRRALIDLRAGRSRPHAANQQIIVRKLRLLGFML